MDTHRFFPLLVSLLLLVLLAPFFLTSPISDWLFNAIAVTILVAALYDIAHTRKYFFWVVAVALCNVIVYTLNSISGYQWQPLLILHDLLSLVLLSLVIYSLFLALFETHKITPGSIYAAICIYLIIGIGFGILYSLIELLSPGAFHFRFMSLGDSTALMLNFSLVTFSYSIITTVGNSQVYAILPFAKSIVVLEEIIGVFYLGVLVARLVTGISVMYKGKI